MLTLQIISALLLLFNKIFVYKKKTIGWIFGMIGAVVVTIYFYCQMLLQHNLNLWIMIIYDIALFFLMVYGCLVSASKQYPKLHSFLEKNGLVFKAIVAILTIVVCTYLLIEAMLAKIIVVQFLSALGGLVGTLLLALHKKTTNKIGWVVYFLTHVITTYLMFKTGSPFIAWCQIASAGVSVLAFVREVKTKE